MRRGAAIERETTLPKVMGAEELARYLGISLVTVYKQSERGLMPGFKIGGLWKYRADEIDRWIREKEEVEKFKKVPYAEQWDMLRRMVKEGFKKAGITKQDIPRLIKEVREEKRKVKVSA